MDCGIYAIRHIATGRLYVGSSVRMRKRWSEHRILLRQGKHHAIHLQHAWTCYGEEAFEFVVLERCEQDKTLLLRREQHHIDTLRPLFNHAKHAGSRLGVPVSAESRAKISAATKGKPKPWLRGDACKRGHLYDEANTRVTADGERVCRACMREWAERKRRERGEKRRKGVTHSPQGHEYTDRDFNTYGQRWYKVCARDRVTAKRRASGAKERGPYKNRR